MLFRLLVVLVSLLGSLNVTAAQPPIEAYGKLPAIRSVSISPRGNLIATLIREGDRNFAAVYDLTQSKAVAGVNIRDVKVNSISFVGEDFAVLRASKTTKTYGFRGKYEFTTAFAWNLKSNKIVQLLRQTDGLFPAQTGLGRIVGKKQGEDVVYMPAYVGGAYDAPFYNIMKVNLKTGRGRLYIRGSEHTKDWLVDENGAVIAREEFDDGRNIYSIHAYIDGKRKKIFEENVAIPRMSLVGVTPSRDALVVALETNKADRNMIVKMSFDGKFSKPIFARPDADVERVFTDLNRVVYGVEYSGATPSYEFLEDVDFDPLAGMAGHFPSSSITLTDWSPGFRHMVMHVGGSDGSPAFYRFDRATNSAVRVAHEYPDVADDDVGAVMTITYKARDGMRIPAILTLPPGAEMNGNHPAIVMPHGGPESYDAVGFHWKAQFFASRGYAVIQPNFRGSDGFGSAFEEAGHGEWGRGVMQHDVSDAVNAMVQVGIADPSRICIVGASYGGYAALAGGAFTPDLYACVAAFAPVSDLPRMLIDERRDSRRGSWVLDYWTKRIGDFRKEREKLESISPSEHADAFKAPVLLIHGDNDTVVPIRQSVIMERALKRADKEVTFLRLKTGDHWHSTSETRLDMLRALDAFVAQHIGPQSATTAAPGDAAPTPQLGSNASRASR